METRIHFLQIASINDISIPNAVMTGKGKKTEY